MTVHIAISLVLLSLNLIFRYRFQYKNRPKNGITFGGVFGIHFFVIFKKKQLAEGIVSFLLLGKLLR